MNKKIRRTLSAILACTMMLGSSFTIQMTAAADTTVTAAESTAVKKYTIKKKTIPTYFFTAEAKFDTPLYYMNGSDVPYMNVDDWVSLYKIIAVSGLLNKKFDITVEKKEDVVIFTRESGFGCGFNFTKDIAYFTDYNAFVDLKSNTGIGNVINHMWKQDDGTYQYIKTLSSSNHRYGDDINIDFGEYEIDLVQKGNNYYIPLQTLSDLFLTSPQINLLYNGKAVIVYSSGASAFLSAEGVTKLGKIYYGGDGNGLTGKISKEMAAFSYHELCLAFDHLYGLKEQHNIKSFQQLVRQRGMEDIFLGTNQKNIDKAIIQIINENLDDIHSSYQFPSYATGLDYGVKLANKYGSGRSLSGTVEKLTELSAERAKQYPSGVPVYEEVGDTAFITLDTFVYDPNITFNPANSYYNNTPTAESTDTIGIIAYSVQQILRKGSPIKNVVLDISCNTGGVADAAIYTVGAFLGKASMSIEDPNTGALMTNDFASDTNFDGKFNSKDTLAGKGLNLYCLTSKVTFSSANFVACAFKNSGKVALIGQTSGGGACSIMPLTTASGTIFNISSSQRMSFLKNGSFYDIDRGADPDYPISKTENFYNREKLAKYIDNIL